MELYVRWGIYKYRFAPVRRKTKDESLLSRGGFLIFAFVLGTNSVLTAEQNGERCNNPAVPCAPKSSECNSTYCCQGPFKRGYCVDRTKNCSKPNSDGVMWGDSYTFKGERHVCQSPIGIITEGLSGVVKQRMSLPRIKEPARIDNPECSADGAPPTADVVLNSAP